MHAKHTLYQLSYIPFNTFICMRTMRFELIPPAWKADNLPLIYIRIIINKFYNPHIILLKFINISHTNIILM